MSEELFITGKWLGVDCLQIELEFIENDEHDDPPLNLKLPIPSNFQAYLGVLSNDYESNIEGSIFMLVLAYIIESLFNEDEDVQHLILSITKKQSTVIPVLETAANLNDRLLKLRAGKEIARFSINVGEDNEQFFENLKKTNLWEETLLIAEWLIREVWPHYDRLMDLKPQE